MPQFNLRDVLDEICDSFLQFKQSVRIVFVTELLIARHKE
jgi:hypothetical protein